MVSLNRLEFVSDAFVKDDRYNNGFKKGVRTSDNNFILMGLVQRQLNLGRPLIVVHVDFTRAFDLINRNILFYKLNKSGYRGRLVDALLDLYRKTTFRIKHNGKISDIIHENIGVNQGGVTSPFLFKEYLSVFESSISFTINLALPGINFDCPLDKIKLQTGFIPTCFFLKCLSKFFLVMGGLLHNLHFTLSKEGVDFFSC